MACRDPAVVHPSILTFAAMESLKRLGVRMVPVNHEDPPWTVIRFAVAPGRVPMSDRVTARTQDALDAAGAGARLVPYKACPGGGIHCSASPLVRAPV